MKGDPNVIEYLNKGLRNELTAQRFNWSKAQEEEVTTDCSRRVDTAIERYLEITPRAPETMFDNLYAKLSSVYSSQRKQVEDQNA